MFFILLDPIKQEFKISKSIIKLHVSKINGEKIYDCLIHSVSFAMSTSKLQVLLCSIATVATTAVAFATFAPLAVAVGAVGTAISARKVRPRMPDFIDKALNLVMVENLKNMGWLIENATEFLFSAN
jgi:archaellum biogenesis protein FlaJ (TadC family)